MSGSLWVRVPRKRLNLKYAISVEEYDGTAETADLVPGGLRVSLLNGRTHVVPPCPEVDDVLRAIDGEIEAREAQRPRAAGSVGVVYDPDTGAALPRQPVEGGGGRGHEVGGDH